MFMSRSHSRQTTQISWSLSSRRSILLRTSLPTSREMVITQLATSRSQVTRGQVRRWETLLWISSVLQWEVSQRRRRSSVRTTTQLPHLESCIPLEIEHMFLQQLNPSRTRFSPGLLLILIGWTRLLLRRILLLRGSRIRWRWRSITQSSNRYRS